MTGQAMHEQFAAIRASKKDESNVMCTKCKKEISQDNPLSDEAGVCKACKDAEGK